MAEFDWLTKALPNLSPDVLAAILSAQAQDFGNGSLAVRKAGDYTQLANYLTTGAGDAGTIDRTPEHAGWAGSVINGPNLNGTNYYAQYDPQGRFLGYALGTDDSSWRDFITAMVMMAPAVAGVYGAAAGGTEGVGGAAGAGGGAGGVGATDWASWAANEGSGALAGSGYTGTAFNAGELAAGAGGAGGAAGTTGANTMRAGEIGSYQTNGSLPSSAATTNGNMTLLDQAKVAMTGTTGTDGLIGSGGNMNYSSGGNTATTGSTAAKAGSTALDFLNADGTLDYAKLATGLLGAYAGYQDGKDKTNTSQVEPWKPAQPYLEGLLREGATLYDKYKQQPFSQSEQTAYGNYGNFLDYINGNAGGLLSGFQANASGANQFSRDNPRRQLIGAGYDANNPVVPWLPQRYGSFGTKG